MNCLLPYLKITDPNGEITEFTLNDIKYKVGRITNENDIVLKYKNELVSRTHCLIYKEKGEWYIRDNQSTNGTIIQHQEEQFQLQESPESKYCIGTEDIIILDEWKLTFIDPNKTDKLRLAKKNKPKLPFVFNMTVGHLYVIKGEEKNLINVKQAGENALKCMAIKKTEVVRDKAIGQVAIKIIEDKGNTELEELYTARNFTHNHLVRGLNVGEWQFEIMTRKFNLLYLVVHQL